MRNAALPAGLALEPRRAPVVDARVMGRIALLAAATLGYAVILAQSRYDAAREDRMLSALLSRRPEAIIMVGSPATASRNDAGRT